ncbi:MAG: inorganic diphosphatase [Candidatus Thiodiazotropha endolucinida]|uniref:Inorganic pyrophosphatase n=2 Tax=Candidatus Thiodiazotropha TaxID=1913444 RepID=A0A7Z0VQ04_9GAMM|nr:inorganic diphosphatase [Candidatus Thiodiazotropha endolucinida]MBT3011011.1 inorganic diphosphatase [Candidatus Thiodiazotropha sp. (ex Lucina pensylvanica)]MBT3037511.1 inorganic diphosphatase [Candidatus Thiodiazotropha sp. (ex Codakia orbicularis)]MBV2123732.1 inorganic diphosphatase [Candidatus Thiodiazotropha taylori]MBT3031688.1 inorganic diphosphatase [Candidatus Thiodiazotropha sp. (ex Lucina pensylvanica)]MBT3041688.1 inorganic diphosphatase [Candidatus Thiodiazotropha sp. (ex Co
MNLDRVASGNNIPDEINVIIEIPSNADPVKYEVDKETGAMFVDRILRTAMHYPANYGYIPHTLSDDGDPCDVMVPTAFPLIPGSVIRCRPVAVLKMTDESGDDAKVIAVPADDVSSRWRHVKSADDMPEELMERIAHFFEHYKDLDEGKWVRVKGWEGAEAAKEEVSNSVQMYKDAPEKPNF